MAGVFFHNGTWSDENPRILGPMHQAFWLASSVFDGARAMWGGVPDLDRHCERVIASARNLGLNPTLSGGEIEELCRTALRRFPKDAELYIRPMFYALEGFVEPVPESTDFVLAIYDSPMPGDGGFSACLSSFRRPAADMAPTDAKASCLYPNTARATREARQKGFGNAVMLDPDGNVAEFASANLWIVRDGVAMTPKPNGTFLNGITKQRVTQLLTDAGIAVEERVLTVEDLGKADEMFSTGNFGKVMATTRFEDRDLQPGPVYRRARELYRDFTLSQPF